MADTPNNEHEARREARLRSRRDVISKGAKLAFIAPVVLGMAQTNVVAAASPSPATAPSPATVSPPTGATVSPPTEPTEATVSPPTEPTVSPPTEPTEPTVSPPTEPTVSPPTEPTVSPPTGPTASPTGGGPGVIQGSGRTLTATLTAVAGATGSGNIILTFWPGQEKVCFTLTFLGLNSTVTAAHIHLGATGGRVVDLITTPGATSPVSACVDADRDIIKEIRKNPENFYVNVHTQAFPAGQIQGTLG